MTHRGRGSFRWSNQFVPISLAASHSAQVQTNEALYRDSLIAQCSFHEHELAMRDLHNVQ